ncbi:uncharacterized protein FIBRA_02505 [Fibroporia radiculosa]|uniref:Uncharacterized protein n=1 Tax=Fibroporia radiculosa TaxID=599839 RepID=J4HV19_9APHY|nr:uncharacterized protein FIBRA_02505 [Fibroporia radiculosa]CCM00472.1 predicted protein [Fibroporia radiculosa]
MSTPPGSQSDGLSTTPPEGRTSSPGRSLRSRMGTAVRRASTLNFPRPNALRSSSSKNSLKVDAQTSPPAESGVPSPVAESPAREAEATEAPMTHGPSPLSQTTVAPANPTTQSSPAPVPAAVLSGIQMTTSPEAQALPLQTPETQVLSLQRSSSPDSFSEPPAPAAPAPAPTSPPEAKPVVQSSAEGTVKSESAASVPNVPTAPAPPSAPATPPQEAPPPAISSPSQEALRGKTASRDDFAWNDENAIAPNWSKSPLQKASSESFGPPHDVIAEASYGSTEPIASRATDAEAFAWRRDLSVSPKQSSSTLGGRSSIQQPEAQQIPRGGRMSTRDSGSSLASSYGRVLISSTARNINISMDPNDADARRGRSPGRNYRISLDESYSDPFADPPGHAQSQMSRRALSPIQSVDISAPEQRAPMSFPLPPQNDVIASRTARGAPSGYSLDERSATIDQREIPRETDERLPLLARSANGGITENGKYAASEDISATVTIPFPVSQTLDEPAASHAIERSGWTEHVLPDSTFYYSHASMRVVTDIDLRNAKKLAVVTEHLKKLPEGLSAQAQGWELWLRETPKGKRGFKLTRSWINHKAHILSLDLPPTLDDDSLVDDTADDDRLDMEYRYWAFMEAHPAHTPLMTESRAEALKALSWSYTDCLLPVSQTQYSPPPFATRECQELMALLRSYDGSSGANAVETRVVARVLLRVAQWRQHYYRPNKPLPKDAILARKPARRTPFFRVVFDFLIACLCLGIPYLFLERSRPQRLDEESGIRTAGPMLMIGGCACLVAAIILSASVTFISLPGVDEISRLAGLLAVVFSAASMVTSVIALFRYKADMGRSVVYVGGEGLMLLSRKSVMMSLPLVFLAWAIAAFITGITFFSLHGATATHGGFASYSFEDHTHRMAFVTMGGMAAMLIFTALLARR